MDATSGAVPGGQHAPPGHGGRGRWVRGGSHGGPLYRPPYNGAAAETAGGGGSRGPRRKGVAEMRNVLWWVLAVEGGGLLFFTPMILFYGSMKWLALILPLLTSWAVWLTMEYMRWGWGRRRWK